MIRNGPMTGFIIAGYLLLINLTALLLFAVDKKIAKDNGERERAAGRSRRSAGNEKKRRGGTKSGITGKQKRRIPEKVLLTTAAIGGSPGAIAGMFLLHHKTRHWQFRYGLPAMLALQMVIVWIAVRGI